MGESWSDLSAAEFLNSQALVPIADENPFAVGPYATGDKVAGIRNYAMNSSPLNYSDVGYDFACNQAGTCTQRTQVHADGEIWSATNYDIRQAMIDAVQRGFPAGEHRAPAVVRRRGRRRSPQCPGNRRWAQLVLRRVAADGDRSGEHGRRARRDARGRPDPLRRRATRRSSGTPSPARARVGRGERRHGRRSTRRRASSRRHADNATVTFKAVGEADGQPVQLFVGRYEAGATPIADTDPATPLGDTFEIVPARTTFVARGNGFGTKRFTSLVQRAGRCATCRSTCPANLASSANGATATGDGVNLDSADRRHRGDELGLAHRERCSASR